MIYGSTNVHVALEKVAAGKGSALSRLVAAAKKVPPPRGADEVFAFTTGMFVNPIPFGSIGQLLALRGLKSAYKRGLPGSAARRMNIRLEKLKTPESIVGRGSK